MEWTCLPGPMAFCLPLGCYSKEAIRAASSLPAQRLNISDHVQIREYLGEDLLLVKGNPLEEIDQTEI